MRNMTKLQALLLVLTAAMMGLLVVEAVGLVAAGLAATAMKLAIDVTFSLEVMAMLWLAASKFSSAVARTR